MLFLQYILLVLAKQLGGIDFAKDSYKPKERGDRRKRFR